MRYCKKCQKHSPSQVKNGKESCMVCGTDIGDEQLHSDNINEKLMNDVRKAVKPNEKTGEVDIAQKVGRNVLIGLIVILAGILYSIGGINWVLFGLVSVFAILIAISIILYIIATKKDE